MKLVRVVILAVAAFSLSACGPFWEVPDQQASLDKVDRQAMRVLEFVPADESEHLRQEAIFNGPADRSADFIDSHGPQPWYSGVYRLVRKEKLSGGLFSSDGTPVEGKIRFLSTFDGNSPGSVNLRDREVYTQAPGKYSAILTPGDYLVDLIPQMAGVAAPSRQTLRIHAGDEYRDFYLGPETEYGGIVSDAEGRPLPNVSVRLLAEDGDLSSEKVMTGEDGRYRIAVDTHSGRPQELEFAPQGIPYPRVNFSVPGPSTTTTLSVRYLPVSVTTISGNVLTPTNEPAANVKVVLSVSPMTRMEAAHRVETGTPNEDGFAAYQAMTDEAGAFSMTIPEGDWKYSLRIQTSLEAPYSGYWEREVDMNAFPRSFKLPERRVLSGTVADIRDRSVAGAEVILRKSFLFQDEQSVYRGRTDGQGRFEISVDGSVPAWDVTILPPPNSQFAQCIRTTVGIDGFAESFVLRRGLRSEGYVIDGNGRPMPRVAVTLVESQIGRAKQVLAEARELTDASGRFELRLPPDDALACR